MGDFKVLSAREEAHKLRASRGISGTAIARDTVWQPGQKFSSGNAQPGTSHQRTELRPIVGPLRMKQRASRVKGVTFVLPGDRGGTRAPSPLASRTGRPRRSGAPGAQGGRGKGTGGKKFVRNKTFSARAAALQRKTQVALDTQTQFLLASLGSHDEKRKAYMYRPERRHTSGRGQTFIAKRPGLLDVMRAYYMTPEQLKERDEADAKVKAKAKKKADKAHAAQEKRRKRFAWERGPESPADEESEDSEEADEDSKDAHGPNGEVKIANNAFYTDQALLKREALRFDPEVLGVLDELWRCVDLNHDERVDKDEYTEMSRKVYDVFVADGDAEASARIASEEWEADRFGHDHLDKHRFRQCWFQLSDLWTDTIEPEEYAAFLRDVLNCLAVRGADGELHFREKPVAIATLEKRSEPKPRPRAIEPKPKVYFDPDKHSKLRARTAEALQMDLERRRSQFMARQMHQIGQGKPDSKTRRVTLSFGGPNRPDEEENGSRSGGSRRGGAARGATGSMGWSSGLGFRGGGAGPGGFGLGDMGLIEEGEEEFESEFQPPSEFYDATPSAFAAAADHKTDLSPLTHAATHGAENRAGAAPDGGAQRLRQGYRTKNKQRGGFRQQLERGRLYVGSGGAELGVGDMDSRGTSPAEFDDPTRHEEIVRKRRAIYERAERARRAAAELTAEDLPDDADPKGLFEQASLLTSSLVSVESTASSHLRNEAWRIRGLLPALLKGEAASGANGVPKEQEQQQGRRHSGEQRRDQKFGRDRLLEQQPEVHQQGSSAAEEEDGPTVASRPQAITSCVVANLADVTLPIAVQSAAPYCTGEVRFANGEHIEVCSGSEGSSDNEADRLNETDAYGSEDGAHLQVPGDSNGVELGSGELEFGPGSGVDVDDSESSRAPDTDSFSQLMQMARQDSKKVGEWLVRHQRIVEQKRRRPRDTMPDGYGDASDGFQRCILEQKRRFGEICLQNAGCTGKGVAGGGSVADVRPTTAPATMAAATATVASSKGEGDLVGVAPGLAKTMQWALGLDVVPLQRSIKAQPRKMRASLTENDFAHAIASASAHERGADEDAVSESSSDVESIASSVEQAAYSAYGSSSRAQEAFHESVQRHDRHVRQQLIMNKQTGDIGHTRAKQRVARDRSIAANEKSASQLLGPMFFNPSLRRCHTAQASLRHHRRQGHLQAQVPDRIRWGGRRLRSNAKHWSPVTEDWVVGKPSHLASASPTAADTTDRMS